MDLSAPHGHSVNDGIAKELCSLHYSLVNKAAMKVVKLGTGTLLAKMDIRHVHHNIPVVPEDKPFLGLNQFYVDQVLLFGLCLVPMIFFTIANALL